MRQRRKRESFDLVTPYEEEEGWLTESVVPITAVDPVGKSMAVLVSSSYKRIQEPPAERHQRR